MKNKSLILNIQRLSTEDGPGIRTTVFFKGCPLCCRWCHNPESISPKKEVEWLSARCISCGICLKSCPELALSMKNKKIIINRDKCLTCLKCTEACPTLALEVKGQEWTVQELYQELIKDKAYFNQSQGGITLSGGEAMLQAEFASELLRQLKACEIRTAVDTCGFCSKEAFDKVFLFTDLFLYDLKLLEDSLHKQYTGQSNRIILDNLLYLAEKIRNDSNKMLWIRTPIIPNSTDSEDNIRQIAEFIKANIQDLVDKWELCTFNNLCKDKYDRLDRVWHYRDIQLVSEEKMNKLLTIAYETGIDKKIICWSGATQLK